MGLDYIDIFYHHRPDSETPLEETMEALVSIVKQGKALYIGLSNYKADQLKKASTILKDMGIPCLIHQHKYSMLDRENEALKDVIEEEGMGAIAFSSLAQGLLTSKYIHAIPKDSRAAGKSVFLEKEAITEELINKIKSLNEIANSRGQSLAQMAIVWALQTGNLTSVALGASKLEQMEDNIKSLENMVISEEELEKIDNILSET